MTSIHDTHMKFVELLKGNGEKVMQPQYGQPMGHIDGYIKTQMPHKDAGSIFKDHQGDFGLFGDMGAIHVTGIKWEDLGLCDARCWYEWMNPESYRKEAKETIEEDKTTISAVHKLGEAISYACGGRYDAAVYLCEDAIKELKILRDK